MKDFPPSRLFGIQSVKDVVLISLTDISLLGVVSRLPVFVSPLLIAVFAITMFAGEALGQSGRRNVRVPSIPEAPVQAPIFSQPEPEPKSAPVEAPMLGGVLTESILHRQIKGLDSGSFRLGDFGDKVIVVNLWASWCGPCRREVPEYEKVRKDYAGSKVEFIGLTAEDPRSAADNVKKFVRSLNYSFRIGWIDRETAIALSEGRNSIPQTLVITPSGRIISHWNGYAQGRNGDRLRAAIERALKE
jgi:thiol-disulfide isomerase/thioredoxin